MADTAPDPDLTSARDRAEGVPEPLSRWVASVPHSLSGDARRLMMAGLLVAHYLGSEAFGETDDAFLRATEATPQWQVASRLVSIAEALFVLRGHPGFADFCAGLRGRDLRSIFFDASVARRLAQAGFTLRTAEENALGLTGWGFTAPSGTMLQLRLCCLGTNAFSREAVARSLRDAASGLDEGAVFLCCYYPDAWLLDCWDVSFSLSAVAREFLAGNGAVNQVGFYREEFATVGEGGAHYLAGFTERNPAPKIPLSELDATLRPNVETDPDLAPPTFLDWLDGARVS